MADLDNLTIKIKGDTAEASDAVKSLVNDLKNLQTALNGVSNRDFETRMSAAGRAMSSLKAAANDVKTNGIDRIKTWLVGLSDAVKGFDSAKFESLSTTLNKLSGINASNLPRFEDVGAGLGLLGEGAEQSAGAIDKIATGLTQLSTLAIPEQLGDQIANLADGLSKLSGLKPPNVKELSGFADACKAIEKSMPSVAVGKATDSWVRMLDFFSKINFDGIDAKVKGAVAAINGFSAVRPADFSSFDTLGRGMQMIRTALDGFPKIVNDAIAASGNLKRATIPKDFANGIASVSAALKTFVGLPEIMSQVVSVGDSLGSMSAQLVAGADAVGKLAPALEKLSQVVIPPEIANQLMEIATALEQLVSINTEKLGALKNQMQGLGSTGKAVQNAANAMKGAAGKMGGKGKNGFVDSFVGGADSLGLFSGAALSLGGRLGTVTQVIGFTSDMFRKMSSIVTSVGTSFTRTSHMAKSFGTTLQKVYYILGTIRRVAYAVRAAFNAIKVPIDLASDLTEVQNVVLQAFGPQNFQNIDNWSKSLVTSFGISSKSAKEAAARYGAMAVSMGISQKQATEMAQTMVERAADIGSLYNKDFETVSKNMDSVFTGMVAPMRKYGVDLTQASLKEYAMQKGMDANIKGMSQMQKALLRYQFVLEKTTLAQGDFARTSDTWANQLKILKTYLEALGSTIGQVFINLFKPIIRSLNLAMNAIIGLVEKTVNAIGRMMGWQIEIAPAFADVEEMETEIAETGEEAADGMEKANKKAKELKRSILSFDEIHALSRPSEDSGKDSSSKGGGTDAGVADAAENMVKGGEMLLKKYESDIKDWFDLGDRIGKTLAESLESINWANVYQSASHFGKDLASYLNGLISPRLFADVGRTVAGALNAGLHFLDSFGTTFNWKNFGNSLAAGLNAFFSTFDFGLLSQTINTWAKGLLTTILRFLKKTNWKKIVDGLNKFIGGLDFTGQFGELGKSIRDALADVLRRINWQTIYAKTKNFAKGLADFLNELITPDLFMTVGATLADVLNTVFGFLNEFWDDFDWNEFGVSLADGINRFFADFDVNQFSGYIGKFLSSFADLVGTVLRKTDIGAIVKSLEMVIGAIAVHQALLISTQHIGQVIGTAFKNGVLFMLTPSKWKSVYDAMGLLAMRLVVAFAGGLTQGNLRESLETVFGEVQTKVGLLTGILGGLAVAVFNFFGMWENGWSLVGEIFKDLGIAVAGVAAVISGFITGPIALLVGGIAAAVSTIAILIHDKIRGDAKDDFDAFIASTADAGHTLDDFADGFSEWADAVNSGIDKMVTKFDRLSSVRGEIEATVSKISGIATAISTTGEATESEVEDLMTSFSNLQTSLEDYIDTYYDAMIEQMIIDMQYLDSQGKLTEDMYNEYAARITAAYKAKDEAIDSTEKIIENMDKASKKVSEAAEQYGWDSQQVHDATRDVIDVTFEMQGAVEKYTGVSADQLNPVMEETKEGLQRLAGGLDLSKEGFKDAKDLTHKYTDTVRDMRSTVDDAKATIHDYYQNLRDNLDTTEMTQEEYNFHMAEYNTAEIERIQQLEEKYTWLKDKLDSEVSPAFETMNIKMRDNLDEMDRTADSKLYNIWMKFKDWVKSIADVFSGLGKMSVNATANVTTSTSTTSTPSTPGVTPFANGGIIEDGLFTMNHGEIAGRFFNGQSVVANNEQIQNGIRDAVVDGMMEVYMATASSTDNSGGDLVLVVGEEEIARASMRGQKKLDKRHNPTIVFG